MRGPTVQPGTTRAQVDQRTPPPTAIRYPAVMWQATLRSPTGAAVAADSTMSVVVDVTGNVDLDGVPLDVQLRPKRGQAPSAWHRAAWQATDGNHGTAVTRPVRLPEGDVTVQVRPDAAGQRPVLYAGKFVAR